MKRLCLILCFCLLPFGVFAEGWSGWSIRGANDVDSSIDPLDDYIPKWDDVYELYIPSDITETLDDIYLQIDGGNSPEANINWGGFDITNFGNLTGDDIDISAGTGDYTSTGTISGDGYYFNVATKTGAYTATVSDDVILCNGTFTITLPATSGVTGKKYTIVNIGTGTITVDGNNAETISGDLTKVMAYQYSAMGISTEGSNWFIN